MAIFVAFCRARPVHARVLMRVRGSFSDGRESRRADEAFGSGARYTGVDHYRQWQRIRRPSTQTRVTQVSRSNVFGVQMECPRISEITRPIRCEPYRLSVVAELASRPELMDRPFGAFANTLLTRGEFTATWSPNRKVPLRIESIR
jgi:hypothetical protein